ncbi:GAF domain-containing protein [Alphaproteobacteria bacterium KMM 3653]|uniref:GAF domain-containing protein n=1 Tax=Harenicola maris TaxID=2841044 RepID=A0AAP2CPL2_9RHOB|nr:GAF domain-containing protein [Harenicola maris]
MTSPHPAFTEFDRALGEASTADDAWAAIHKLTVETVGGRLFSVMLADWDAKVSSRVYTTHPEEYPLSGTKPFNPSHWWQVIHTERKPFVANTLEEIAEVFPDPDLIGSLGLGSVINIPVVLNNRIAGTLNVLDAEHFYTPERAAAASLLMLPGKAACLAATVLSE